MNTLLKNIALSSLPLFSTTTYAETSLSGKIVNFTSYFTESERIRHNRYEFHLIQNTAITNQLSTKIEGRFRFDAALDPDLGAYSGISHQVRDDEMAEAEARQLYVDYLNDYVATKIGIQQIDWVESLSPRISDVLTPLDLRHGGYGDAKEIIEPVFAASLNHKFFVGSLEWLYIPTPKMHRLAKGKNGYGYYETLMAGSSDNDVTIVDDKLENNISESEGGLRYLLQLDSVEFTLLAFHGHQRQPALRIKPLDPSNPSRKEITETHPQSNTFGTSIVYAGESLVTRLVGYYEPKRRPSQFLIGSPELYERRGKVGLGLDYLFAKHLKIYSEHFITRNERFYLGHDRSLTSSIEEKQKNTFTNSIRLTNETFEDVFISLDASFVGPEKGRSVNPKIAWTIGSYKVSLGGQMVQSDTPKSALEPLKNSDQIYVQLESFFDSSGW